MSINFFGLSAMGGKNYGEVWKPKTQRLMVGRDIAPITSSELEASGRGRGVVVGNGDDVAFMSGEIYKTMKSQAQRGLSVRGFRSFETTGLPKDSYSEMNAITLGEKGNTVLSLSRSGGSQTVNVFEKYKDEDGKEQLRLLESVKITGDAKISWVEGQQPQILTGSAALSNGVLKAEGEGDILIRNSAANVKAGNNTKVYNFSESGGDFSGGSNVTYLGSYKNSVFSNTFGENNYAGYFEASEIQGDNNSRGVFSGVFEGTSITSGDNDDVFSGYFSGTVINAGNGENLFSGMFLDQSTVNGGDDEDTFNGRFVASTLNGGKGDDVFGGRVDLDILTAIMPKNGESYNGLAPDFINSVIEAGEGDDQFIGTAWESQINMGDGDDTVKGVFSLSGIDGGAGNDHLSAMYALTNTFNTGSGDDTVILGTAATNSVKAGEGSAKISLGYTDATMNTSDAAALGGDSLLTQTTWFTPEEHREGREGTLAGELSVNFVDISEGENKLSINQGKIVNKVATGDILEEVEEPENAEEAAAEEKAKAAGQESEQENSELALQAEKNAAGQTIMNFSVPASEEEQEEEGDAKTRKVIGRYVTQSGDAPLESGGLAAFVKTGLGDNLNFRALDRGPAFEKINDDNSVSHLLRKASTAYDWTKKLG